MRWMTRERTLITGYRSPVVHKTSVANSKTQTSSPSQRVIVIVQSQCWASGIPESEQCRVSNYVTSFSTVRATLIQCENRKQSALEDGIAATQGLRRECKGIQDTCPTPVPQLGRLSCPLLADWYSCRASRPFHQSHGYRPGP